MNRIKTLHAAEFAHKACGRSVFAILDTLHLVSSDGKATITGSNNEIFTRHSFPCEAEINTCISGKKLLSFLQGSTSEEVTFEQSGFDLRASSDDSRAVIQGVDPKDFPEMFSPDGSLFDIPAGAIKQCLPAVCQVQAPDNARICGVYIDKSGYVVSFDRRRTHTTQIESPPCDVILPSQAATILAQTEGGSMRCDQRFFLASGEAGWQVAGKLIEGPYGNWKKLMELRPPIELPVPETLCDNLQRAMAWMAVKDSSGVLFEGGKIIVEGLDIECELDGGFPFRISPFFLQQAIKAAGEGCTIQMTDAKNPFMIRKGMFLAAVMPMRMD